MCAENSIRLDARQRLAIAASKGLPVFSTPKAQHQKLAHCSHDNLFGFETAPGFQPRHQRATIAELYRMADRAGMEGRNLEILLRWSGVDVDVARIQEYTTELVHVAPEPIVANATPVVAALKRATQSIPIVFVVVNDPVAQGIVSSVARPEGNITGFSFLDYSVVEKSLELLKQVAPGIARAAVMFNPETYPYYNVFLRSFETVRRGYRSR